MGRFCASIAMGSSPRIRGEFFLQIVDQFLHRIIPANTGRMAYPADHLNMLPDHPREYGENFSSKSSINSCTGSSPRIRGEWHTRPTT